ncbi:MAG: tetratricopeptide repeat protein, partial [Pyrinomonadaceae bacterium]|nr:tetratricopeptide repeat protein [Phycisphaerales bacterium]
MASRVNVRFVVFLAIGLIVLAGSVVTVGFIALRKSADEHVVLGDKKMLEGSGEVDKDKRERAYAEAASHYSRAIHKASTNPEWCLKWIDALEKLTPSPQQAYIDKFRQDYTLAWVALQNSAPQDASVQGKYLEWTFRRLKLFSPTEVQGWESMAKDAKDVIERFEDQSKAQSLRRYRGIANTNVIRIQTAARSLPLIEPTVADLEAAIKADPHDSDSVIALAGLKVLQAGELRDTDPAQTEKLSTEAHDLLTAYIATHAPASAARLTLMQLDMNLAIQSKKEKLTWGQLYLNFGDQIQAFFDALQSEKGEAFDSQLGVAAIQIAMSSPKLGPDGAVAVADALLKNHPSNPTLLMAKARAAMRAKKVDEGLSVFQRVVDMPDLPLSLDGLYLFGQRADALVQQVNGKLSQMVDAKTSDDREKVIAAAKDYRKKLVAMSGEEEAAVLLIDARILLAENKIAAARIKLDEYNSKTDNTNMDAVSLMGELLFRTGNLGGAKEQFDTVLRKEPSNSTALMRLGELEMQQQRFTQAAEHYNTVLGYQPGNLEAKEKAALAESLALAEKSPDAIVRILSKTQALITGINPNYKAAADLLREELKTNSDARLHAALASMLMKLEDGEGARRTVEEGLAKFPSSELLKVLKSQTSSDDPLETAIKNIDNSVAASPIEKEISRVVTYRRYGKMEEARAALQKAASIDKNNPFVIELQFGEALQAGNMDEAKKLAEAAVPVNADNVNGLTFRARIEIVEKRYAEAAATLEQSLETDKLNVPSWRLLGTVRQTLGQMDASEKAFAKALEINPNDIESITGFLRTKWAQRATGEALAFARANQSIAGGDPEFAEVWLSIESEAPGGDKSRAISVRREMAKRLPDNQRNNFALAILLIDGKQWPEARKLIDELRAKDKASVRYLELDAHWHLAQQNTRGAAESFNAYIAALPPNMHTDDPYISLAGLLMRYGQTEAALVTLTDGRKRQDPKEMRADRELAESLFALGRFDRAIEAFERVAASKPADLDAVNNRMIAAYLRGGRLPEAKAKLDALGDSVNSNANLLLLKADVLTGMGDRAGATGLYDKAIAVEKSSAFAFVKRGDYLMSEPGREKDAEDDLKQAISLDPRMYIARQRLAVLYLRSERLNDAIDTLSKGVAIDPDNDELRMDLMDMLVLAKKGEQAIVQLEQAVERNPNEPNWLARGRELMAKLNRWDDSAAYASKLWDKNKSSQNAIGYVDTALRSDKPDFTKILAILATPELNTTKDVRLLITRARARVKQNRITEATQDLATALSLVDQTSLPQVGAFFAGLEQIYPQVGDRLAALKVL